VRVHVKYVCLLALLYTFYISDLLPLRLKGASCSWYQQVSLLEVTGSLYWAGLLSGPSPKGEDIQVVENFEHDLPGYCLECVKFGRLILWKMVKIFCRQMSNFKAKMHPIRFRLGHRPRPRWGSLQRSPRPPSWMQGDQLLRGGRGGEGKGREGMGRKGRGKEGRGKGEGLCSSKNSLNMPWLAFALCRRKSVRHFCLSVVCEVLRGLNFFGNIFALSNSFVLKLRIKFEWVLS